MAGDVVGLLLASKTGSWQPDREGCMGQRAYRENKGM